MRETVSAGKKAPNHGASSLKRTNLYEYVECFVGHAESLSYLAFFIMHFNNYRWITLAANDDQAPGFWELVAPFVL